MMTLLAVGVAALMAMMTAFPAPALADTAGETADEVQSASSDVEFVSCNYSPAPTPFRSGNSVAANHEISGCAGDIQWQLTLQRLRGPGWWQNETFDHRTGNGPMSLASGCTPDDQTHTYRTIIEATNRDNVQDVSGHAQIACQT